jgi:hypothetical protein
VIYLVVLVELQHHQLVPLVQLRPSLLCTDQLQLLTLQSPTSVDLPLLPLAAPVIVIIGMSSQCI